MTEEAEHYANVVCFVAGDKIELVVTSDETDPHVLTLTIDNAFELMKLLGDATVVALVNKREGTNA